MTRRILQAVTAVLTLVVVVVATTLSAGLAVAATTPVHNPLRNAVTGKPLSCPDPSVIRMHRGHWRYFLFCTSDNARNAFPIYMSPDLVHWYPDGSVFPAGHEPSWATPSDGRSRKGIFWAPSIDWIDGRWTLYFAAAYNPASHAIPSPSIKQGRMVIGVATSSTLAGPWHSQVLYYSGEFNADNTSDAQELNGGDIDPGEVYDPRTHRRYLFWAQQRERIWEAPLSSDGLTVGPVVQRAFGVTEPWECSVLCTIEGPQPFYHDGMIDVLYSAASTWNGSYVVGAAASTKAMNASVPFVKKPEPVLRSGPYFKGPGGESDPVVAPDGETMIMYHALTRIPTSHDSGARVLMLGRLTWSAGFPLISGGTAR